MISRQRLLLCVFFGVFAVGIASADEKVSERTAVVDLVTEFFDAMTARDIKHMSTLLTEEGFFYGYREGPDGLTIIKPTHSEYMQSLAQGSGTIVERFWNPRVLLHGRMATVWTPYDLYRDGKFSHCGINNFNLLKTDEGWKVSGITFSMETDDCGESPLGPFEPPQ